MIATEPCCYGFIVDAGVDDAEPAVYTDHWVTHLQRPFRGKWLWLWGDADAELTSLQIGGAEQLVVPLPFAVMHRPVTPEQFLRFVREPHERMDPAIVSPTLAARWGAPHLDLATGNVGAQLRFGFRGGVRGVVLVGEQIP